MASLHHSLRDATHNLNSFYKFLLSHRSHSHPSQTSQSRTQILITKANYENVKIHCWFCSSPQKWRQIKGDLCPWQICHWNGSMNEIKLQLIFIEELYTTHIREDRQTFYWILWWTFISLASTFEIFELPGETCTLKLSGKELFSLNFTVKHHERNFRNQWTSTQVESFYQT